MTSQKKFSFGGAKWLVLSLLGITASIYILTDTITYALGMENPLLGLGTKVKEVVVVTADQLVSLATQGISETQETQPVAEVSAEAVSEAELEKVSLVLGEETVNLSGYQAVHLTNGQIYFGELADENNQFATLKKVYYYRKTEEAWQLTALSDEVKINRDHILYFEPLKADSKVVQAIEQYKLQQGQ